MTFPEGNAIVYCEGVYTSTNGKTAHGLVRRSKRYRISSIIDSSVAGKDAGEVLDGRRSGIPILRSLGEALAHDPEASHFVIGLAPDGGRLPEQARLAVVAALRAGLNVDSGLHDYLNDDVGLAQTAAYQAVSIRDIRRPPHTRDLHFFSGKIEEVGSVKVAILGTDSAVGKRTTAWMLVDELRRAGVWTELVGTGQTAWLQGARFGVIMDSLPNDFVSGEIEHAVWSAWDEARPKVIVIEGQGSLLNPAYPGGFEILAAARPDLVILQHAPARQTYDGFPGSPMHSIEHQIDAVEIVSGRKVVALTLNREGLTSEQLAAAAMDLRERTRLPVIDVLGEGVGTLAHMILKLVREPDNERAAG